jgi:hypothetical protein
MLRRISSAIASDSPDSQADALEIAGEIEAGRHRLRESRLHGRRLPRLLDEVAHDAGLGHVEHHQVSTGGILHHLAGRGLGLFVIVLAVDHRGVAVLRVALHPLPDVEHRSASGVHQHGAQCPESLEVVLGDPEGGQDHHVVRADLGEVEPPLLVPHQKADPHVLELLVHMRIVDDLAHQVEPAVGELAPGLVSVVHGPVDPVAEPELPGQPEAHAAHVEAIIPRPECLDHRAVIIGGKLAFDFRLEAEPAPEVGAFHGLGI